MNIRSLGYRTDLIFPRFEGIITDRGDHLIVTTPSNPTFWWGNFILFHEPPKEGDLERWGQIFTNEIGPYEQVGHMVFGIDGTDGDTGEIQPFLDAGFKLEVNVVLTAREVTVPPKLNTEAEIHLIQTSDAWEAVLENQVACRTSEFDRESYTEFKKRQLRRYRAMMDAGLGAWFGASLDGRPVADLGIFMDGDVGRYQSVVTHPDYQRRGLCGTLVYHAARHAFKALGVETLVMIADPNYHAARIYESVGFRPTERQVGLERPLQNAEKNGNVT